MSLQLTRSHVTGDSDVHLIASGDVTVKDLPLETSNPLDQALPNWPSKKILIDFSRVGYVDSSAIGWLISCQKNCRRAGGQLVLHSISPSVRQVLDLLRIGKVVPLAEDQKAGEILLGVTV